MDYRIGQKVIVNVSKRDGSYPVTGKLNGKRAVVSMARLFGNEWYYELEGMASGAGIPYAFDKSHLKSAE